MKKNLLILLSLVGLCACSDSLTREVVTYKINEPVFMSKKDFRQSVQVTSEVRKIENYGKICFHKGFLYISEPGVGLHVLDNRKPENPKLVAFVEIVGNADLAIEDDVLYADSYVDMVYFDLSNPAKPVVKGRLEDAFPDARPAIENGYAFDYERCRSGAKDSVVVAWNLGERSEEFIRNDLGMIWHWGGNEYTEMIMDSDKGHSSGLNGSMSRFGLHKSHLYVVANNRMSIFRLSDGTPEKKNEIAVGWNVETIFSYGDNLFLGTPTGLLIYSLKGDLLQPNFESSLQHVYGCDPVVVADNLAYVSIRSGNICGQSNNELIIIDVSDVRKPRKLVSYAMKNPKGLAVDDRTLFLCDDGLKIYRITEPGKLLANLVAHYPGMDAFDVIAYEKLLMLIADKGIYQYDYSDLNSVRELSFFPMAKAPLKKMKNNP